MTHHQPSDLVGDLHGGVQLEGVGGRPAGVADGGAVDVAHGADAGWPLVDGEHALQAARSTAAHALGTPTDHLG